MVVTPSCFHALTDESVAKRWEQIERQIEGTPEDDHDAQWSTVLWCACCCGPSKGELCSRCSDITPEQYQMLMTGVSEAAA